MKRSANYYKDAANTTPINDYHHAIETNDIEALGEFILRNRNQADSALNQRNSDGLTPLAAAVQMNRLAIVELLVESGENIHINEKCGASKLTALNMAISAKNHEMLAILLKHDDLEIMAREENSEKIPVLEEILCSNDYYRTVDNRKVNLVVDIINHRNFDKGYLGEFFSSNWTVSEEFWIKYIEHPKSVVHHHDDEKHLSLLFNYINYQSETKDIVGALLRSDKDIGMHHLERGDNALTIAMTSIDEILGDRELGFYKNLLTIIDQLLDRHDLDLSITNSLENYGSPLKPNQNSNTYLDFISSLFFNNELKNQLEIEIRSELDKYFEDTLKAVEKYITHPNFELKHCNIPDLLNFFDSFENFRNSYGRYDEIESKQSINPSIQITLSTLLEKGADVFIAGSNDKNSLTLAAKYNLNSALEILLKRFDDGHFWKKNANDLLHPALQENIASTWFTLINEDNEESSDIFINDIIDRIASGAQAVDVYVQPPMAWRDDQGLAPEPTVVGSLSFEPA